MSTRGVMYMSVLKIDRRVTRALFEEAWIVSKCALFRSRSIEFLKYMNEPFVGHEEHRY